MSNEPKKRQFFISSLTTGFPCYCHLPEECPTLTALSALQPITVTRYLKSYNYRLEMSAVGQLLSFSVAGLIIRLILQSDRSTMASNRCMDQYTMGKQAVIAGQIPPGFGDQRRQAGNEIQWFECYMRGAVAVTTNDSSRTQLARRFRT